MPFVADKPASRFVPDAPAAPTDGVDPKYANDPAYQELIAADAARTNSPSAQRSVLGNMAHAAKEMLVGVPELAASGVTGLAASASNLVNSTLGTTALFKNPGESDADFYQRQRVDHTYQPRGEFGQAVNQLMEPTIGRVVNAAGSGVTNLTGDQAAGELTKDALNVLPAMVGAPDLSAAGIAERAGVSAAKDIPIAKPVGTIPDNPTAAIRAAGFKLPPSDAAKIQPESTVPGTGLEKFAGTSDVRKDFIGPNQRKATQIAATDIGLPSTTPRITPKMLDEQRAPQTAVYNEVGQAVGQFNVSPELATELDTVSNQTGLTPQARALIAQDVDQYRSASQTGPDMVKTISALRRRSNAETKSQDVNTQDIGHAHRQVADALENELTRQVSAIGQPELAAKLQDARTALAKINDVDSATKAGQVDPQALNKAAQKGAKLSGGLKIIADAAEYAPHVMKHEPSMVASESAASPFPFLNPLLDVASLGARPMARKYLSSDSFQNKLGTEAPTLGPNSRLGEYFQKPEVSSPESAPPPPSLPPTPASAMHRANTLAGDLTLAPEPMANQTTLPATPSRLTASTPAATPNDGIPFTSSAPMAANQMAGNLSLADELTHNGGVPFNPPNGLEPGLGARQLLATQENSRPMNSASTVPPETMKANRSDLGGNSLAAKLTTPPDSTPGPVLKTLKDVKDQPIKDEHILPGSTVIKIGNGHEDHGFLAYQDDGEGGLMIKRATVDPAHQGKGHGQELLMEAARQAEMQGKPLSSDQSVTVAQLHAYEALKRKGLLTFDYANPAKVEDALTTGTGRTVVKQGGNPVVTNIRLANAARKN